MAFIADDQTDEDFFDKLVGDDFGTQDSHSKEPGMVRVFSNLSIVDEGAALDDAGEVGFTTKDDDLLEDAGEVGFTTKDNDLLESKSSEPFEASNIEDQLVGTGEAAQVVDSLLSSSGKAGGFKVKTVQWSALNSGGFGSFSDFLSEKSDSNSDGLVVVEDFKSGLESNRHADSNTLMPMSGSSYDQIDNQFNNSVSAQVSDLNDSQYLENLYPGWKYGSDTGQWYQVDGFDSTKSLQSESCDIGVVNVQDSSHAKAETGSNGHISNEVSSISYLHHSTNTITETVMKEPAIGSIANWNQASSGTTVYPTNMVFDPQYPGWYYDTNTQQWYTLESYVQTIENSDGVVHDQLSQSVSASVGLTSKDGVHLYNGAVHAQSITDQGAVGASSGTFSNFAHQNFWHSQGDENNVINFSDSQQNSSFYGSTGSINEGAIGATVGTSSNFAHQNFWNSQGDENSAANFSGSQQTSHFYGSTGSINEVAIGASAGTSNNFAHQNFWHAQGDENNFLNFSGNQQTSSFHGSTGSINHADQFQGFKPFESTTRNGFGDSNVSDGFQGFVQSDGCSIDQFKPSKSQDLQAHFAHSYHGDQNQTTSRMSLQTHLSESYYGQQAHDKFEKSQLTDLSRSYNGCESLPLMKGSLQSNLSHSYYENYNMQGFSQHMPTMNAYSQFSHGIGEERSSAGRPPHALVSFGFGGLLVVMKDSTIFGLPLDHGSQDVSKHALSVLQLSEVVGNKTDNSSITSDGFSYFNALCQQLFPGPLVGGNVATKDVYRYIDEKIKQCESPLVNHRKGELVKLLLSLVRISCQHYGKLRSPFGADPSAEEVDGPESAVTKLFASARSSSTQIKEYGSSMHCIRNLPSEAQIQRTAVEVQKLLVSGRRKEALQLAQDGQLWGPALVLAAQLGEKFYVDTVRQMAHTQLISGSPLRTLCLLIAGQPADVFSTDYTNNSLNSATYASQSSQVLSRGMLDEWEENLAIITANRTKDDELVIVHLGDSLWKERQEVTAAHTCYLVAEANFESYSDSSRLCLIGADHWKYPRTYANPEAIQMTELYEYSKVLGNSQFILLPFQPYKVIYAHMLAEVGRVSDSLRYCQASQKLLKNAGRTPEVETWKSLFSSLEERLKTHQQGGYGTNLAPAKLVGKLFTSIDRSIHRMMGAPPAPLPPIPAGSTNDRDTNMVVPKVANSQSSMAISSMFSSASVEGISEQTVDGARNIMHNRSISEPDFGRSPKQNSGSPDTQGKVATSRFSRIGSSLLQKTVGWVSRSRSEHQAKLGGENKFYYDEKLKTWVEEGAEPPTQQVLPPPPTVAMPSTTTFQNGTSDYNINNPLKSPSTNGGVEAKPPGPSGHTSGTPPIPPSNNQFSARARMGVRSRYVDTFNKGGASSAHSFHSLSAAASAKPAVATPAKFFVPAVPAPSKEEEANAFSSSLGQLPASNGEPTSSSTSQESSISPPQQTPSPHIQRFPSMDNITPYGSREGGNGSLPSRARAASWSGSYGEAFGKGSGSGNSVAIAYFTPRLASPKVSAAEQNNSGVHSSDELQEVEL